jgi:ATP-dependent exoDNAse (exonuclease V) beta subunit
MTVHKAKGLEFPVVVLADLTCRLSRDDASRYLDAGAGLCAMRIGGWAPVDLHEHEAEEVAREQAEGVRLAYVAATRARDLLVVPALGDAPWEGGWLSPLNASLYPGREGRRTATRAPRCPPFKSKDSVLVRPNEEAAGLSTVAPGLHRFDEGYEVVWWDPGPGGGLRLGERPTFGVRRDDLIVKDVARDVVAGGRGRYDRWCLARADARSAGSQPTLRVETARESRVELDASTVTVVSVVRDGEAVEGGAAFGTLVHAVLARAPFDATREALAALARLETRLLGLDATAAERAAMLVERMLAHPILRAAHEANERGACRREVPVSLLAPDGTLVEGVVDLAFERHGEWTIVDYKTDRELASGEDEYRRQVALYAAAVGRATGQPSTGVIVHV